MRSSCEADSIVTVEPLLVVRDEHVVTWTINRPEQRNAITDDDMVNAFCEAAAAAGRDRDIRAIVLTGIGESFSSGGNVKAMIRGEGVFGLPLSQQPDGYRSGIQRLALAVYTCDVPMIAAVNGPAIGAGCDLALMCDLRIASTDAVFAESFVKLGLIPGDGGAWLLTRTIGAARAAEMTLTGDAIDAQTALEWGLVSKVVEPRDLIESALALAHRVAVNPPVSVRMAKRLLRGAQDLRFADILDMAASMQAIAHQTNDHAAALEAIKQRRAVAFDGS